MRKRDGSIVMLESHDLPLNVRRSRSGAGRIGGARRTLGIPNDDVVAAELISAELVGNAYRYAPVLHIL